MPHHPGPHLFHGEIHSLHQLNKQEEITPHITPLYSLLKLRGEYGGIREFFRRGCLFNDGLLNNLLFLISFDLFCL